MTYAWYDIFGTLGVAVIILTYVLLQIGRVKTRAMSGGKSREKLISFSSEDSICVVRTSSVMITIIACGAYSQPRQ